MALPDDARYAAFDIDGRAVAFLNRFFALAGVDGRAVHGDIVCHVPTEPADMALVLKTLPCLERQEPGSGRRLLEALRTRRIVVSFPVASLGGHDKGMRENYERTFRRMVEGGSWQIARLDFPTELVFVLTVP
jgi:16S rRNA (guanine(1405)-N(7))-methyltransferase